MYLHKPLKKPHLNKFNGNCWRWLSERFFSGGDKQVHKSSQHLFMWNSPKASSPVIADTGSATMEHIPLHIFSHKVLNFSASYLVDSEHFESLL